MTEVAVNTDERGPGPIAWEAFRDLARGSDETRAGGRGRVLRLAAYALWVISLVIVFISWNGASSRAFVALQTPYVVSGALTALLLTIIGSSLFLASFLSDAIDTLGDKRPLLRG
jgi:hypothetical protein